MKYRATLRLLGMTMLVLAAPSVAKAQQNSLEQYQAAEPIAAEQLATFDTLDFDIFTNQKWDRFPESHARNITVYWPDGRVTNGIKPHIEDLKAIFTHAPDTRIREHPIKIAQGEWTSVVGILEGTFTKPMVLPDGKVVQPTGKAFKLRMATIGRWNGGVMTEEYPFWDNAAFMRQIGIGQ